MAPEDAAARPTDDFHQLKLLFSDPLQHDYEVIRPIVLFAEQVAVRSEQTGIHRSTVGEKARRFVQNGMLGLLDQRSTQSGRKPHTFPEGWHMRSIAGCMGLSRQHVSNIIDAFERDGFAGLENQRRRPPDHSANQLTFPLMKEILDIQRDYPKSGRFRVRGLLSQRVEGELPSEATIGRAMAKNRALHGAPGPWETDKRDDKCR
jgi:hypothetical protein